MATKDCPGGQETLTFAQHLLEFTSVPGTFLVLFQIIKSLCTSIFSFVMLDDNNF
jgi:hypothetical protein